MADKRYLVFDVETVPDWTLVRQVFGLGPELQRDGMLLEVEKKYSSGFLPPPFQIPICIAMIDVLQDGCRVQNAIVISHQDEKSLLEQFWRFARCRKGIPIETVFVHFNGRSFDLPVLFYRSLKHRVPIVRWERRRHTFESLSDLCGNHDICDDLAEFGASQRPSLDVVCKMMGLPGKTTIDGSDVEDLYARGDLARIKDYCMEDALATYQVWITMKFIRGEITEEKYKDAFDSAAETIRACRQLTEPPALFP